MEREPVTFVLSEKGWVRALKGHVQDVSSLQFKGDDALKISFPTKSTAKVLVLASNGKLYTLDAGKLPGGRGFGDPVKLMVDFDEGADVVTAVPYRPGSRCSSWPRWPRLRRACRRDVSSTRRDASSQSAPARPGRASDAGRRGPRRGNRRKSQARHFPIRQVAEMGRGSGVRLPPYKSGGISDARVFRLQDGLTWTDTPAALDGPQSGSQRWIGNRGDAGRLPPKGYPKSNCFS